MLYRPKGDTGDIRKPQDQCGSISWQSLVREIILNSSSLAGQIVVCPDHPLSGNDRPFKAPAIIETLAKGQGLAKLTACNTQHLQHGFKRGFTTRGLRWLVRFDPMTKERRKDAPQIVLCGDSAGATQANPMCTVACSIVFHTFQLNLAHIDIDTHCMPCMHGYMILPLLHSKRQNSERGGPSQIMMDAAGSYSYLILYRPGSHWHDF